MKLKLSLNEQKRRLMSLIDDSKALKFNKSVIKGYEEQLKEVETKIKQDKEWKKQKN
jgi:hypothetical protein